jgi:hypothetical protein
MNNNLISSNDQKKAQKINLGTAEDPSLLPPSPLMTNIKSGADTEKASRNTLKMEARNFRHLAAEKK